MSKNTTINDIAEALRLSKSTVSRALNDSWEINDETKERVLGMAVKMHYRPNVMAKNLTRQKSGTIGLILPEFETGFFSGVIMGIQSVLNRYGYRILITQSGESAQSEKTNLELLLDNRVEGLLVSACREGGNVELFRKALDAGVPIVFFNRVYDNLRVPKVIVDDKKMSAMAVKYLLTLGAKRILHMAGPSNMVVSAGRLEGYKQALKDKGIEFSRDLVVESGFTIKDGEDAMTKVLSSVYPLPDAVFAFNDQLAVGGMRAVQKAGLRVPEDIKFFGFSEGVLATAVEPALSSVKQPTFDIGEKAADLLVQQIVSGKQLGDIKIVLEGEINIRESTNNII